MRPPAPAGPSTTADRRAPRPSCTARRKRLASTRHRFGAFLAGLSPPAGAVRLPAPWSRWRCRTPPSPAAISDFDVQVMASRLGRKEMEEFGIVHLVDRLNKAPAEQTREARSLGRDQGTVGHRPGAA